ncbi:MAG: aldehyde dehydrogenase family protein [Syntrophomonadaceae bacterium]|jgi:acyl-CoA reductase-like NAD-dependent aldehyde dehydrogenase|nr:aldehyde dehydrogenase family protein [Bacillota bacterium]NLM88790.1 aldehyde dehydrogenase [Syntrophomonadaceae bacterium]HAA09048.1 aldehyde dehydrogenase [Syntrophomonas sp.]HQA50172.1 aldehyde dehydrogenase family protein [Syntrophomonadaceae bacterium]HQD91062.1 aldehyde dehydrogenase family protein [Syntrophomonadaceae bacterium]
MMSNIMEYQMFIDGEWTPGFSGDRMEVINPATQELVATVPRGTREDVDRALDSARQSFESGIWADKSIEERAQVLMNAAMLVVANKERLGYLESLTSGATIRRTTTVDVAEVAGTLLLTAMIAKELPKVEHTFFSPPWVAPMHSFWKREPVGVCAGITPWNFPLILAIYKIAPALAMGNSIVLKPASITPVTTLELAKILSEAGVPPGVFNVITGPGSSMGNYLAGHPEVDKIAFTGSTEVGRQIAHQAADTIKRVTLELGGKSPIIVLDDADMEVAANMCLLGFLFHSGQVCESGTRLFVPRSMQDELVERMIAKIKKMVIGNQLDMETDLGPIASQEQLNTICRYVQIGKEEGAQLAYGGNRMTEGIYEKGFFHEPTIFINCNNKMTQVREEIFGPVQCVIPYDDVDEAIAMANDSIYGLGGGICSTNASRAQKLATRLRTGTVWINTWHVLRPDAPFGGYKQSGYGRECSYHSLMAYSEVKHICQDLTPDGDDKLMNLLIGLNR